MTAISAAMVKELRDKTGAGIMDCKAALTENDGNIEAAIDYIEADRADNTTILLQEVDHCYLVQHIDTELPCPGPQGKHKVTLNSLSEQIFRVEAGHRLRQGIVPCLQI